MFATFCQRSVQLGHGSQRARPVPGERRGPAGPVTLHDVAREADVAVSTASRALSNPDRVSRATREHVQTVARRLGYRPNRRRALPSGRTSMLALLVHDITNPHNFGLIRGAEAQARAAGYTLVIGRHPARARSSSPTTPTGWTRRSTGSCWPRAGCPTATCGPSPGRDPVALFNREVAGFAERGQRVRGQQPSGRRAPGGAGPPLARLPRRPGATPGSTAQRWRACPARRRAGVEIVRLGPFLPTLRPGVGGRRRRRWRRRPPRWSPSTTCWRSASCSGCSDRGVDVPGRVSVVGYDDIFGADFCHPPLTTVAGPVEAAGRLLVDRSSCSPDPQAPN